MNKVQYLKEQISDHIKGTSQFSFLPLQDCETLIDLYNLRPPMRCYVWGSTKIWQTCLISYLPYKAPCLPLIENLIANSLMFTWYTRVNNLSSAQPNFYNYSLQQEMFWNQIWWNILTREIDKLSRAGANQL